MVVIRETDNTNDYNGNTITKVEPSSGTSVESGTQVTIFVNTPNRVNSQYVPDVVGMSLGKAKGALQANGLRVGGITEVPAAEPAGTVLGQSIGAGARVSTGSYIALTVSSGINEQEHRFSITLPYSDKSGKTTFKWSINVGGGTVANGSGSSNEKVYFTRTGSNDESGTLTVNGKVYKSFTVNYQDGKVHVTSTNTADFYSKKPDDTHQHTLVHHDAVAPSCEKKGKVEYWECTGCDKKFSDSKGKNEINDVTIAALGHNWEETHIDNPTCTEPGQRQYECSRCRETKTETIDALGHSWSEWVVVTPATEEAEGDQKRTCSRCGAEEHKSIPKLEPQPDDNG